MSATHRFGGQKRTFSAHRPMTHFEDPFETCARQKISTVGKRGTPLGSPKGRSQGHITGPERISAAPVFLTRFPQAGKLSGISCEFDEAAIAGDLSLRARIGSNFPT
jgi:hypothetical protein